MLFAKKTLSNNSFCEVKCFKILSGHPPLVHIMSVDVRGNGAYIKRCFLVHKMGKGEIISCNVVCGIMSAGI